MISVKPGLFMSVKQLQHPWSEMLFFIDQLVQILYKPLWALRWQ